MRRTVMLGLSAAVLLAGGTVAHAQQAPMKLTLFGQPSVNNDAVWMAMEKGFYKERRPRRDVSPVPVRHHRISDLPDRAGRHRHERRSAERAVFLPRQRRLPHHRGARARCQGLRRCRRQGHQDAAGSARQDSRDARRLDRLVVRLGIPAQEQYRSVEGDGEEPRHAGAAGRAVRRRDRGLLHLAAGRFAHARDLRRQGALPVRRDRLHPGLSGRGRAAGLARRRPKARKSRRAGCAPP